MNNDKKEFFLEKLNLRITDYSEFLPRFFPNNRRIFQKKKINIIQLIFVIANHNKNKNISP